MSENTDVLPCPFCGHIGLDFSEGSTFRWMLADCGKCGATAGETRVRTVGEGTHAQWWEEAKPVAIGQWNTRAPAAAQAVQAVPGWAAVLEAARAISQRHEDAPLARVTLDDDVYPLLGTLEYALANYNTTPQPPAKHQDHSAGGECGRVQVPLTNERLREIYDLMEDPPIYSKYARAIEAAHNIHPAATPDGGA